MRKAVVVLRRKPNGLEDLADPPLLLLATAEIVDSFTAFSLESQRKSPKRGWTRFGPRMRLLPLLELGDDYRSGRKIVSGPLLFIKQNRNKPGAK